MRKKMLALCLSLILCISLLPAALAVPEQPTSIPQAQAEELAGKLKALGLFLGDETGNFDLDSPPTRTEALVMLIRALGEESQAKAAGKTHPFADVPGWADGYVSWGYAKGYTKGISVTEFGAGSIASCEMYLTFLLRALGYTEGLDRDFTYDKPYFLAYQTGIFPSCVDFTDFRRSDVVEATVAALFAGGKGNNEALHTKLTAAGTFTAEDFDKAFPSDPYETEKQLNSWIETTLDELIGNGRIDYKNLRDHSHVLYSWEETDQGLQATAFVKSAEYTLAPDNSFSSMGSGGHFYQFIFEPKTGRLLSYDGGLPWPEGWDYDAYQQILSGVVDQKMEALFASGTAGYIRPSYEVAVDELRKSFGYYNEETIETPQCTIFIFDRGGMMNAPSGVIKLIYKAGSALGEGYMLDPPHVRSGWRFTPADTMAYDPEKGTFTYSYFSETTVYDNSIQGPDTRSEPGTYTFTVDLATGEFQKAYRPIDYAGAMTHVTRKRIHSSNEHSEDREVVQTLETDLCTIVLTRGRFVDKYDDYILSLVYKPGSALGDGAIKRLLLPSTVYDKGYPWYVPTDRAPDSLELNGDGSALTYVYHFDEVLEDYHKAGTYTYTVDLTTGELSVTHTADE